MHLTESWRCTLWIKIWEELHRLAARDIVVEVECVKAHRTKKRKRCRTLRGMSLKATRRRMSWQKQEQCWTKDLWRKREQRQSSKKEEDVYAALQYGARFHCLVEEWKDCEELKPKLKEKWIFVDQKREETKHRTEWCAEANKYRCMRCGRGKCTGPKYLTKMPGKCTGPKFLSEELGKRGKRYLGGHDLSRKMDSQGEF